MLQRILGSLERESERELYSGVDPRGALLWSRTGRGILLAVGSWQETLERRGVRPGDRVAIDLPRGPDLLPAHLAVLSSGATVVPINPSLSGPERARVLERAEARTVLERDELGEHETGPRQQPRDPATPALLIFTSGTTGEPKGVPLSLANLEANLAGLEKAWGLSRADRLLHVLPCHHVHGLVLALYGPARLGMPILLAERFIAEDCLHALAAQRATLFMGVPTMFHRMAGVQHPLELPGMRLFVSGSAPLSEADFLAFEASFGQRPLERYGLSETLIVAANPLHGERRPGTVGHPLPGTRVSKPFFHLVEGNLLLNLSRAQSP